MSNGIQLPPVPVANNKQGKVTFIVTIVCLAFVLGGVFYWKKALTSGAKGWQPQAVPVTAMTVTPRTLDQHLDAVGTLKAVQQVTLSAETAGRIEALNFHSGQIVKPQQLLVQLYDGTEQAALSTAKAKANYARLQLKRSQQLAPKGAESVDVLQERQSALAQAQAEVQQAEALIRQKKILAPFTGLLGIRQVNQGQYLNPGQQAVTLTALDKLYVEFTLPQQQFSAIQPGGKVKLTTDAYPNQSFEATVNAVEPQVDNDTRNILVQAEFENPKQSLRPGMYVNAALVLPPTSNAILLPATAVETSAQGYSVVVIRGEQAHQKGNAEIVAVEIGQRIGDEIQILSGVKAGDVVVTAGQNRIPPGAEVVVQQPADTGGKSS
ncbi:efflux RND transporter periplasmic adaptor subunit [Tolumonas lignilytica]|uniref:efflux RND transporter periplasmic adaptor subunit n=1 Tax=Tolumonas lignilytica TaxID=1283284 RepID=UPI000465E40D|nr:efflux RND transporter periplasmic adaptor subunit [Tolumonas lignilytica]